MITVTIKTMTLSKRLAKQIQFRFWDVATVGDAKPLGWVARDTLEQGSREAFLFDLGQECFFMPTDHFCPNGRQAYPEALQIFLT